MITDSTRAGESVDGLLGQVANEFFERLAAGEQPDVEEYARRHPEIAGMIREIFPALDFVRDSLGGVLPPGPSTDGIDPSRCHELGDFRIVRELGRGGMGVVYEAEQLSMGRRVALKVLPFAALVAPKALQRFRNEVRAAATLDHPHITSVYSVGEERGVHYYAMQLVRGQSLAAVLKELTSSDRQTPLSGTALNDVVFSLGETAGDGVTRGIAARTTAPVVRDSVASARTAREYHRTVARLGIQAAEALEHAHGQGVVHRDIKPGNLLLDSAGKLSVADFGLARIEADANLTMTGDVVGTLRYMSPEQALGHRVIVDHRTDIYSLGATLYELLTLQPPFVGENRAELLRQIASDDARPLRQIDAGVPRELETIILCALGKDPNDRYNTAAAMAADLRAFLDDRPIQAKPPTLLQKAAKWSRRHKGLVATTMVLLLLSTIVLTFGTVLILDAWRRESAARQGASAAWGRASVALSQANEQRQLAQQRALDARRTAYVSDMRFAFQLWNQGLVRDAQMLLDAQVPEDGLEDLRGLEWYVLSTQIDLRYRTIGRHDGPVTDIDVFPDGRRFATSGEDGVVCVWDAETLSLVREFRLQDKPVYTVGVSPDGKWLAYGAGSRDDPELKYATLLDAETGVVLGRLNAHDTTIRQVRFSPDGRFLASASLQEKVSIWKFTDGTAGHSYDLPCEQDVASEYFRIEFIEDAQLLTEFHERTGCRVWDVETGEVVRDYTGLSEINLTTITWCARQSCIGYVPRNSGANGRTVACLLDSSTGGELARWDVGDVVTCLEFSPHGQTICVGTESGRIRTEQLSFTSDASPKSVERTGHQTLQVHHGAVSRLRHLDERRMIAGGVDGRVVVLQLDPVATQQSPFGGNRRGVVTRMAASPDNDVMAWAGVDGSVRVADRVTGRVLSQSEPMDGPPTELVWSGDGTHLAAFCRTNQFCCWRIEDDSLVECLRETVSDYSASGTGLALSRDGSRLYVGDPRGSEPDGFHVWHVPAAAKTGFVPTLYEASRMVISPDDRLLVAGSEGLFVFDRETGSLRHHLQQGGVCTSLLFAPDRRTLVAGYQDGAIRLWNPDQGRLQRTLTQYDREAAGISVLLFAPDGRTLFAGDWHGRFRCWNAETWGYLGVVSPFGGDVRGYWQIHAISLTPEMDAIDVAVGESKSTRFLRIPLKAE